MSTVVTSFMVAAGLTILLLTWRAFQAARVGGDLDFAALLLFAAVVLPNATTAVAAMTGERVVSTDSFFRPVISYSGGLAGAVNLVASPLLVVVCLLVLIRRLAMRPPMNTAPLLYLLVLIVGAIAGAIGGYSIMTGARLGMVALVLAAAFVQSGRCALTGAALGCCFLLGLGALTTALQPETATAFCDRKCGVLGFLFVGTADNYNASGLFLALSVPVIFFGLRRYGTLLATAATLFALMAGSRTGQLAAVISLMALLASHADWITGCPRRLRYLAPVLSISSVGFACVLPFVRLSNTDFTGRAALWEVAKSSISSHPWTGLGPDQWVELVQVRMIPPVAGYSTHNELVEVLYVGGLLGLAMLTFTVTLILKRAGRDGRLLLAYLVMPVAICSITERPMTMGRVDWMSWCIPVLLVAAPLRPTDLDSADESIIALDDGENPVVLPTLERSFDVRRSKVHRPRRQPSLRT